LTILVRHCCLIVLKYVKQISKTKQRIAAAEQKFMTGTYNDKHMGGIITTNNEGILVEGNKVGSALIKD
jgi:hypothetical protein